MGLRGRCLRLGAASGQPLHPNERTPSAVRFLRDAVAYYARLGVPVRRLLTDNGSAFRSRDFAAACKELLLDEQSVVLQLPPSGGNVGACPVPKKMQLFRGDNEYDRRDTSEPRSWPR